MGGQWSLAAYYQCVQFYVSFFLGSVHDGWVSVSYITDTYPGSIHDMDGFLSHILQIHIQIVMKINLSIIYIKCNSCTWSNEQWFYN